MSIPPPVGVEVNTIEQGARFGRLPTGPSPVTQVGAMSLIQRSSPSAATGCNCIWCLPPVRHLASLWRASASRSLSTMRVTGLKRTTASAIEDTSFVAALKFFAVGYALLDRLWPCQDCAGMATPFGRHVKAGHSSSDMATGHGSTNSVKMPPAGGRGRSGPHLFLVPCSTPHHNGIRAGSCGLLRCPHPLSIGDKIGFHGLVPHGPCPLYCPLYSAIRHMCLVGVVGARQQAGRGGEEHPENPPDPSISGNDATPLVRNPPARVDIPSADIPPRQRTTAPPGPWNTDARESSPGDLSTTFSGMWCPYSLFSMNGLC